MNNKVIITNLTALKAKYGADGVKKLKAAIKTLIAADKARGFQARLVALDSATTMKKVKGSKVTAPLDPKQNKDAVDAIYTALVPDYLLLLGAIDVVPHQDLRNPVYGGDDPDQFAPGDLPYACEAPYSQQPQDFIGPTRVIGRLPDLTGAKDPAYLLGLLATAANWKSLTPADYSSYFAISADVWKKSTALSVQKMFGSSSATRASGRAELERLIAGQPLAFHQRPRRGGRSAILRPERIQLPGVAFRVLCRWQACRRHRCGHRVLLWCSTV